MRLFLHSLIVSFAVSLLAHNVSYAGGFGLREQSAIGQGSSFSGVGAGGNLSSMFWNPATSASTATNKWNSERVFSFITPISEINPANALIPSTGDIGLDAFLTSGYMAYRYNDRLVIGFANTTPFGLSTKVPLGHPARAFSGTSEVLSVNLNPNISYQINDWLAVGAGVQVQYFDVRLTNNSFILSGDDIGFGFTAGVQLTPFEGTEIGIGFRSAVKQELEGDLEGQLGALNFGAALKGPIGVDLTTPEQVSLGIRQRIGESWRVMGSAEWTNWSRIGTFPVINRATSGVIDLNPLTVGVSEGLAFDYEDGWYFSGGVEYNYTDHLTLRAGVGYELSPIGTDTRGYRLPDDDRLWLSAGLTYAHDERFSFDLGYSFVTTMDTDIVSPNVSVPAAGFDSSVDSQVHIVSMAMNMKLEQNFLSRLFSKH